MAVLMTALLLQGLIVTLPWFISNCRSRSTFLAQPFPHTAFELARGQPFLAIAASGLYVVFPTVSLINARWSSRTAAQWMVPAIVELSLGNPAERRRAAELRKVWTRQVKEDLNRYSPAWVAVRTDDHNSFGIRGGAHPAASFTRRRFPPSVGSMPSGTGFKGLDLLHAGSGSKSKQNFPLATNIAAKMAKTAAVEQPRGEGSELNPAAACEP
jgi:hypothetical protein